MRELEFRAWNGIEMISHSGLVNALTRNHTPIISILLGGETHIKTIDGINKADHILMQYTGLKDKKGIKIFEGDIIQYDIGKKYRQVLFCNIKLGWRIQDEENDFSLMGCDDFQIIGNVHENPELLDNK